MKVMLIALTIFNLTLCKNEETLNADEITKILLFKKKLGKCRRKFRTYNLL